MAARPATMTSMQPPKEKKQEYAHLSSDKPQFSIPSHGDEVVISGISGRFPESFDMKAFKDNLLNGKNLLTHDDRRWKGGHPELPTHTGKIDELEKFDAGFFGVHYKQAHPMDPMCRLLLERTYEAIIDAGVNPRTLRGSRLGVYVGTSFSETEKTWLYEKTLTTGLGITGCSRAMYANRISYWLGATGPSYAVDTACSSGLYALHQASEDLKSGKIDAAVVGGTNLVLHPNMTLQFKRLGVLSSTGSSRPFDVEGDGYVRSEAIVSVFLQRAKDARRIYATVLNSGVNCDGYKEEGITFPSRIVQAQLMREICQQVGVDPKHLAYIEAHATGTKAGDKEEMAAIHKVFYEETDRKEPMLVGSVKSNMGHAEPASGLCSIAKMLIAMEERIIPPTINYKSPKHDISALCDGTFKVVTEPTPWEGGIVGVNAFGFGGANAHVLLRSHSDQKPSLGDEDAIELKLPRLVLVSARTPEGIDVLLDEVARQSPPHEGLVNLLHSIHETNIPGHVYRGFDIMGAIKDKTEDGSKVQTRDIQYWSGERRPVWFVFTGMGCHWPGMGAALMQLPVFAAAIQRCHAVMKTKGMDVVDIITSTDPKVFDNVINCFVGITAIQIGLVDVLREVGIIPDMIIGHSMGEVACAYADGCLTTEQTILATYSRGRASSDATLILGAMAAVGLGADELAPLCPPEIDIACRNSSDSSTISGPAKVVGALLESLKAKGIFAREVSCANIPFHGRHVAPVGEILLKMLKELIPSPRPRSERWLSTSVPESRWESPEIKICSAEYQTNNLLHPVLFDQVLSKIPPNAIAIEIAPHGLLQAILKRALPSNVINVPLTKRDTNSLQHLLSAIGRLYNAGLQPETAPLYPAPRWPVPRGTPMLSPLVRWAHEDDWFVSVFRSQEKRESAEHIVTLTAGEDENETMIGHIIDGRPLIPATGYLKMVWEALANLHGRILQESSIVFEGVHFLRATRLPIVQDEKQVLNVVIHRGSGDWEVSDNGTVVVRGRARIVEDATPEFTTRSPLQTHIFRRAPAEATDEDPKDEQTDDQVFLEDQVQTTEANDILVASPVFDEEIPDFDMNSKNVYKCLRLRGYNYQGAYRGIVRASPDGHHAIISWRNNWISFLDCLLQLHILPLDSTQLYVPTAIDKIVIDASKFLRSVDSKRVVYAQKIPELDIISTNYVEIRGMKATPIARRRTLAEPILEHYDFMSYEEGPSDKELEAAQAARVCAQVVLENQPSTTHSSPPMRVIELLGKGRMSYVHLLLTALADIPLVKANATVFLEQGASPDQELGSASTADVTKFEAERDVALMVLNSDGVNMTPETFQIASNSLARGGGLLVLQSPSAARINKSTPSADLQLVMTLRLYGGRKLLLFKKGGWRGDTSHLKVVRIPELVQSGGDDNKAFSWVKRLQEALKDPNPAEKRVVLVARGPLNGALGLFNCLRMEPGNYSQLIRLYLMPEEADVETASMDVLGALGLRERLEMDLAVNVLQGGRWGSLRHLKLPNIPYIPLTRAFVNTAVPGDLSSFQWFQAASDFNRTKGTKKVYVHYSSLNFKDVMLASGKLDPELLAGGNKESPLGFEFSGRLEDGRRVMGMNGGGSISTEVEAPCNLLWDIPQNMTLQEAATIPTAYGTAIYALDMVGLMSTGESVLVHAASGAVGQAAITLALARGCRVFATAGTQKKRDFLLRTFPQLNPEDIGNSRDLTFEEMVLRRTQGKGVDLVLNSLAADKLQASLRCLGNRGRFLEIGKVDMFNDSPIGMRIFLKEVSVNGILLETVLSGEDTNRSEELHRRMQELLKAGIIRPLCSVAYSMEEVENAFRTMAAAKHIGKVLIAVRPGEPGVGIVKPKPITIRTRPKFYCVPKASYVLVGGLGGLGLELAHRLVHRGARFLVLVSRRGVTTGYQARRLLQWREAGVRVLVRTDDTATAHGAEALLRAAEALAPVAAIFNLAVVLRDGLFENQTPEAFRESFRCKASATVHLDAASRRLCPRLSHFVVFSSVSCGRGNAGQTNYGFANSVMERVARARRAAGLPATAVQWGAVGDVGLVADMRDDDKILEIGGTLQQQLSNCLEVLDGFLMQDHPVVASMVVAEKKAESFSANLTSAIATLLGVRDLKTVSQESTLAELGMDSMMTVEIQQTLARDFDVLLAPNDVRSLTFSRLTEIQTEKMADKKQTNSTTGVQKANVNGQAGLDGMKHAAGVKLAIVGNETISALIHKVADRKKVSQPLVSLASAATDASRGIALIFPGIEGVAVPLEPLAQGLTMTTVALQLPLGGEVNSSVDAIVAKVMTHVHSALALDAARAGSVLLGYSYGGLLALETAAQLEAKNKMEGNALVLIDSSPIFIKEAVRLLVTEGAGGWHAKQKKSQVQDDYIFDKQRLEEELLIHMLLFTLQNQDEDQFQTYVRKELAKLKDWESRLALYGRLTTEFVHSKESLCSILDGMYHRILALMSWNWPKDRPRLQTPVTLIRPTLSIISCDELSEDYGLSEYCEKPVRVLFVDDADHYTIFNKQTTTMIINSVLHEDQENLKNLLKTRKTLVSNDLKTYSNVEAKQASIQ